MMKIQYGANTFKHGEEVMVSLKNSDFFKAKLYIESPKTFYICHNENEYNGQAAPNKLGCLVSWVISLNDNNESTQTHEKLYIYHNFDAKMIKMAIDHKVEHFMSHSFKNIPLLELKLGIIDMYDSITDSKELGFVDLHSSQRNKKLTIKLGRLLRKLIVAFNSSIEGSKNKPILLNDELIETLHNKWMSYNLDIEHEILEGEDLLKGYTSSNYTKDYYFDSCMSDRHNFLKMYTENPNQIGLMVFYLNKEICGRCLIWNCDDGKTYHDRIYSSYDWITPAIERVLNKKEIPIVNYHQTVKLDKIEFSHYPYMDTFQYGEIEEKILSSFRRPKSTHNFRTTTGSFTNL